MDNLDSKETYLNLIDFDDTVNFSNEPETCKESDRSSQEEEKEHHNERVAKIQECTCCVINLKFCGKIVTAINE